MQGPSFSFKGQKFKNCIFPLDSLSIYVKGEFSLYVAYGYFHNGSISIEFYCKTILVCSQCLTSLFKTFPRWSNVFFTMSNLRKETAIILQLSSCIHFSCNVIVEECTLHCISGVNFQQTSRACNCYNIKPDKNKITLALLICRSYSLCLVVECTINQDLNHRDFLSNWLLHQSGQWSTMKEMAMLWLKTELTHGTDNGTDIFILTCPKINFTFSFKGETIN